MNREIKFRAWDKEYKNMFSVTQLALDEEFDLCLYSKTHGYGCVEEGHKKDFVLMQYTGLKDKNGKEIYEGDIVEDLEGDLLNCYLEGFRYIGKHMPGVGWVEIWHIDDGSYKIIGNIYENPELLNS